MDAVFVEIGSLLNKANCTVARRFLNCYLFWIDNATPMSWNSFCEFDATKKNRILFSILFSFMLKQNPINIKCSRDNKLMFYLFDPNFQNFIFPTIESLLWMNSGVIRYYFRVVKPHRHSVFLSSVIYASLISNQFVCLNFFFAMSFFHW